MSWDAHFEKLVAYQKEHGHCYVWKNRPEDAELRRWLHEQYKLKRQDRLSTERREKLDALKVDWQAYGAQWERWESNYLALCAYKQEHGHCHVSQLEKGLGPWLSSQRVLYRQGYLPDGRKKLLTELGVDWSPAKRLNDRWEKRYQELVKYYKTHGDCEVSRREYPQLGTWVSAQRTAYRKKTLTPERQAKLERINFRWKAEKRGS